MRSLTESERAAIDAIVKALPPERRHLIEEDLHGSEVEAYNGNEAILVFRIAGYNRPQGALRPLPIEATALDEDGAPLAFILHADENDRLYQLETIRWAEGPVIRPNLSTLVTFDSSSLQTSGNGKGPSND